MTWNPNDADGCVVGLEWAPGRQVDRPVGGVGDQSVSWTMEATVTEDVNRLWTYSASAVSSVFDTIEIYEVGDLDVAVAVTDRYYPSDDAPSGNVRRTGGRYYAGPPARTQTVDQGKMTTAGDEWWELLATTSFTPGTYAGYYSNTVPEVWDDEVPLLHESFIGLAPWPATADALGGDIRSSFSQWSFRVNGLETGLTGRRVLGVTVSCVCQRLVDPRRQATEFDQPYRVRPALRVGGTQYFGQVSLMPSQPGVVSYTWVRNPATGLPWTATELQAFDTGNYVQWLMSRPDDPQVREATAGAIYSTYVDVRHVDETRSGFAIRSDTLQQAGWQEWTVYDVAGTVGWSKTAGDTYLFNRRLDVSESVEWLPTAQVDTISHRMLGDGPGDANGFREVRPVFSETVPRGVGDPTGYAPAVVLVEDVGGTSSPDSQPYAVIGGAGNLGVCRVGGGDQVWQLLTFDASVDPPDRVRFYARSENEQTPGSALGVYIVDSGANVEAESTVVVGDDLLFPGRWQAFDLELNVLGWDAGLSHTAIVRTFGSGVGWEVLTLTTGQLEPNVNTGLSDFPEVTYGGTLTALAAGGDPFAIRNDADAVVTVGRKPVAPANLTATYTGFPAVPRVTLEWDGVPGGEDCSDVAFYEVQRKSEGTNETAYYSDVWQTIYRCEVDGTEDTYTVDDFEIVRVSDVSGFNQYRVRLVATTGFASEWSDVATVTDFDDRCGFTFTSNAFPDFGVWLDDVGVRSWDLLEEVTYYEFEGRDGAVEARGLSDRLDAFGLELLVAAYGTNGGTYDPSSVGSELLGRRFFDYLACLTGNKRIPVTGTLLRLPYVAIADSYGNRWFASVRTPSGTYTASGGQHRQQVEVREVTRIAHVVTVTDVGGGVLEPVSLLPPARPALPPLTGGS